MGFASLHATVESQHHCAPWPVLSRQSATACERVGTSCWPESAMAPAGRTCRLPWFCSCAVLLLLGLIALLLWLSLVINLPWPSLHGVDEGAVQLQQDLLDQNPSYMYRKSLQMAGWSQNGGTPFIRLEWNGISPGLSVFAKVPAYEVMYFLWLVPRHEVPGPIRAEWNVSMCMDVSRALRSWNPRQNMTLDEWEAAARTTRYQLDRAVQFKTCDGSSGQTFSISVISLTEFPRLRL
mmetsp:Transcript_14293/g.50189  ORF Transcript_14293/g.50189 Transcript_14293/m.50189 type:complete len:237 (-) Transcript_14293:48-758(-)